MLLKKRIRFIQIFCLGTLAACQLGPVQTQDNGHLNSSVASVPVAATAPPTSPPEPQTAPSTAYRDAINLASGAFSLGQRATSPDDWDLIVGRWEQAIQKLKDVPATDQNYSTAQTKLKDYERNLAQAKQQLKTLKKPTAEISLNQSPDSATGLNADAGPGTRIPIIERRGGTPVIEVMVNGRRYPMILDTGASHTHITRAMADQLGVEVIGQASVATASSRQAVVDVGYVDSIKVGNVLRTNLPVSIGDAVPIGLLGNDVYEDFDVILQINSVEFRPR